MIMRKASLIAVIGLLFRACQFLDMNALILFRAAVVFMLVYIDVASAINRIDPGGTLRVMSSFCSSNVLLK